MRDLEAIERSRHIVAQAGYDFSVAKPLDFLKHVRLVADILKFEWSQAQRDAATQAGWYKPFVEVFFGRLAGEFEQRYRADPMLIYRPQHSVAEAFHASNAFIRFFRAGNRCSKTQSGYAEHYLVVTNQHKWRYYPKGSHATAIVGVNWQKYPQEVFLPKMIVGEVDNILSPMFPEGGKWLCHYDRKHYRLTIACPECAEDGRAGRCPDYHVGRSTTTLYSNEAGKDSIMGAQFRLLHLDEHVKEEFYWEGRERLGSVANSSMIITGTPLDGPQAWEQRIVAARAIGPEELNRRIPSDPNSPPYAALFQIDKYSAGIVPREQIDADSADMSEAEKRARIWGEPIAIADKPVFNTEKLDQWFKLGVAAEKQWQRGEVDIFVEKNQAGEDVQRSIEDVAYQNDVVFRVQENGRFRMLEEPKDDCRYVLGVDTAAGLDPGDVKQGRIPDASCCSVFKLKTTNGFPALELVAQYHGWVNPIFYAREIKKIGVFYNNALACIELTGGLGRAVMETLRGPLCYAFLFRPKQVAEQADFALGHKLGLDTNQQTKPEMVGAGSAWLEQGLLELPCKDTVAEMQSFTEYKPKNGVHLRFQAMEGAKDDRVMSVLLAVYAVYTNFDVYRDMMKETFVGRENRREAGDQSYESPSETSQYAW